MSAPISPPSKQPVDKNDMEVLQDMAHDLIQQSIDLIKTLNDAQYTHFSKVMPEGTIGKHTRHVCDHFNLLYDQCDEIPLDWVVDYDIRKRNNPSETDRSIAIDNMKQLQLMIKSHGHVPLQTPLTLLATIDPANGHKFGFKSSFGRELFYCCIHAIHHYASIKAICIEQGIPTPHDFGMAPSTLQDQQIKVASSLKKK